MTRTIDQMIASEVLCCMSSLVATLANGGHDSTSLVDERSRLRTVREGQQALGALVDQAFELGAPIDDWEEAAIQAGWKPCEGSITWISPDDFHKRFNGTAESLCHEHDIEPAATEVYEHWAVTDWFADKLEAAGEKVDRDFGGLAVWARTTTGQSMTMDGVVQRIYAQTHTGLEG